MLEASEMQEKIDKCIAELPEKCREVFLMNRFENMKYKEIANRLDISEKTVEAHISKALSFLRSKLLVGLIGFINIFLK